MFKYIHISRLIAVFMLSIFAISCKETEKPPVEDIVAEPEKLDESAADNIHRTLNYALDHDGDMGDSVHLFQPAVTRLMYDKNAYVPFWSSTEQWKPLADSLFQFITQARLYGLFPEDYHEASLVSIRNRFAADSLMQRDRRDAALWAKADLLLTDAFFRIIKDVKYGRLPNDSVSLRKDTLINDDFFQQQFNILQKSNAIIRVIKPLEPRHTAYHALKAGIPAFLDSADNKVYTIVPTYKQDSINYRRLLQTRLFEGGYLASDSTIADSVSLANAVKKFQKERKLTVDGRAGEGTLREMNLTDEERFVRIAITLDKFKKLPDKMPERYVWVNLPAFYMVLRDKDTVRLESKIICGKPQTRTPLLNSSISEIITYPQWTVPASIIEKEILPAVKRNPDYLAKKGFSLVDKDGEEVDPFTVEWSKYKKGIPYKVVQGSGDDNALGILKFNFPNKYAVYLHDTNQRSLFARSTRSLSHGCVRVQEWQRLALYMIRGKDEEPEPEEILPAEDSLNAWLERKEKHSLPIKNRLPLFIRYHTVEGTENGLVFYDDIYGEDKRIQEAYYSHKQPR